MKERTIYVFGLISNIQQQVLNAYLWEEIKPQLWEDDFNESIHCYF